jgi:hypothetical protein
MDGRTSTYRIRNGLPGRYRYACQVHFWLGPSPSPTVRAEPRGLCRVQKTGVLASGEAAGVRMGANFLSFEGGSTFDRDDSRPKMADLCSGDYDCTRKATGAHSSVG